MDNLSSWRRLLGKLLACLVPVLFVLALYPGIVADLAAQGGKKAKPPEEEEEDVKPGPKPKPPGGKVREEEEEEDVKPVKPKSKKPRVEEEEEPGSKGKPPPEKPIITQPSDLAKEAEQASHPAAKKLFEALTKPHDIVRVGKGGKITPGDRNIVPLPRHVTPATAPETLEVEVMLITPGGKVEKREVPKAQLKEVVYFEEMALKKIDDFLAKASMERLQKLQVVEKALLAVLHFHETTRERAVGGSNPWADLESKLADRLLSVRRDQVLTLAEAAEKGTVDWAKVFSQADRLAKDYPNQEGVPQAVAKVRIFYAENLLRKKYDSEKEQFQGYLAARQFLTLVDEQAPGAKEAENVRRRLHELAEELVKEAEALKKTNPKAAIDKLEQAQQLDPRLPGLQTDLLKMQNAYPILYVGVRSLPKFLSPALAWTDPEKQAVELIFESLIRPSYDKTYGQRYFPGLAPELPRLIPLGRQFQLAKDAYWSDGERVTSADIRHTSQLLADRGLSGRSSEWEELVKPPRILGDPFQISFTFKQGYLDPLSLLTFKILPLRANGKELQRADDENFAKSPVGSGPFQYLGIKQDGDRKYAQFVANPNYRRSGRPGMPQIREIHFFVPKDPAGEFKKGQLHLLLDLPSDRIKQLQAEGIEEKYIRTLPNRRVYFLAVNHREPSLKDLNVRRALAHAINREEILNKYFRDGNKDWHKALTGPFPANCWASSPTLDAAKAYKFEFAETCARQVEAKLGKVELRLLYPEDDPRIKAACEDIRAGVEKLKSGISIKLEEASPHQLRDAVRRGEYQLAYYHLDYPSETYWLWPLFDTHPNALEPGGSNFLGYENDDELPKLLRLAMSHRNFAKVAEVTRDIHTYLFDKMPLIPLWQLDTHLAIHPDLKTVRLNPLRVFTFVEEWQLQKR
jgi:peptide/nickel transport system substrate-binding protein